jgi:hypothetical protein
MLHLQRSNVNSQDGLFRQSSPPIRCQLDPNYQCILAKILLVGRRTVGRKQARRLLPYKKRSMIGPSFLIVAAGHSFRSVMIALSRA